MIYPVQGWRGQHAGLPAVLSLLADTHNPYDIGLAPVHPAGFEPGDFSCQ